MKNTFLYIRWEDLHGEIGVDPFNLLKVSYSNLSVKELAELIKELIYEEREDVAAKCDFILSEDNPVFTDNQHVIYKGLAGSINYKDLLLSLATTLAMTNCYDHVQNILYFAKCLRNFDREICDKFVKDIAEEVYHNLKHGV
ncbi:hypothetical protein NRS6094_03986 [Bacillus subtilis]|uniref:hypothetical protein n=1 Tax=Bacillus subtilis TaxID=1423 RepID=UPI001B9E0B17|nr:hypothetical protein [Bacillus subtilis]CAF1772390.1 hypothetical protein NRS6094_03986 [Bacillus subtilis]